MGDIVVEVCAGTHCTMMGSMNIIDAVHSLDELWKGTESPCEIRVRALPCFDLCKQEGQGPFVRVNGRLIAGAESDVVMSVIMDLCREQKAP